VHTLNIAPVRSETPPQKRSGMARVLKGSHSTTNTHRPERGVEPLRPGDSDPVWFNGGRQFHQPRGNTPILWSATTA